MADDEKIFIEPTRLYKSALEMRITLQDLLHLTIDNALIATTVVYA